MQEITIARKKRITTKKFEFEEIMASIKEQFEITKIDGQKIGETETSYAMQQLNKELENFMKKEEAKIRVEKQ